MLSRYMLAALIIAAVPRIAAADAVLVRQFTPTDRLPQFVIMPPRLPTLPAKSPSPLDLATDFANASAFAPEPRSVVVPIVTRPNKLIYSQPHSSTFASCSANSYRPNPALAFSAERRRATWYASMAEAACDAGVPVGLFDALIIAESRYNPVALSPKGAAGLAQLMPTSALRLGISNVWDPSANLRGGAHLLRTLLNEFGRFDLALAAYNAGAGRVRSSRQVPRIRETLHYVATILTTMRNQLLRASDEAIGRKDAMTIWQHPDRERRRRATSL